MDTIHKPHQTLAAEITRSASKQTYYSIRFLVDRDLVEDAYRAYAYFRWVDDTIDTRFGSQTENMAFIFRQKAILEACYHGESVPNLCPEEQFLADLIHNDRGNNPGLRSYLGRMMAVMEFDAGRRGRLISQAQLSEYTQNLAIAVTDAMHYFIGHGDPAPAIETRYTAVTAAHITHMLRDSLEDQQAGYFNIPQEYLQKLGVSAQDLDHSAYRDWVFTRVKVARQLFKESQKSLSQIQNLRCRLAGYAYAARFEWMLRAIERDNYRLQWEYPERKKLRASAWMAWRTLRGLVTSTRMGSKPGTPEVQTI